jgi:hypothetical protein
VRRIEGSYDESEEMVIKYHEQGMQYLAPVTITEDKREIALSVSDEEFKNNKLDYRDSSKGAYWAVFRPITFEYNGRKVTDGAMVVKSETKLRNDRKSREKAIKSLASIPVPPMGSPPEKSLSVFRTQHLFYMLRCFLTYVLNLHQLLF